MDFLIFPFLAFAAFIAGILDSAAGGGGLITLPALLLANVPPHLALGTNKFQSMLGTSCAVINYGRKSKIIWKLAAFGIPFTLIGSLIGARLALILPASSLAKVLVIALPMATVFVALSKPLIKRRSEDLKYDLKFWITVFFICSIIGTYDGFFGPGTGTFLILALTLLSHVPIVKASATAKTFNLASNLGAFVTFMASGNILYVYGITMALANIAGNYIGSHLAMKHEAKLIQKLVLISLSLLFAYLIWKNFFSSHIAGPLFRTHA